MNINLIVALLPSILCSSYSANIPPPLREEEVFNLSFGPNLLMPLSTFGVGTQNGLPRHELHRETAGQRSDLPLDPSLLQYTASFSNQAPYFSQSRREIAVSNTPDEVLREWDEIIEQQLAKQKRASLKNIIKHGTVSQIHDFMLETEASPEFIPFESILVVKRINLERGNPIWSSLFSYFPRDSRFRTLATAALELDSELAKSVTKVLSQDIYFMKKYKFKDARHIYRFCGF